MAIDPVVWHAQMEPWAFFCTLTFAGKVLPSPGLAFALQRRWLDRVCPLLLRIKPDQLHWLSREELGERTGRFHLHLLLGAVPDASRVNPKTCLAMMTVWEQVTQKALGSSAMARVRVFQPTMQGVDYVLKGLSDVSDFSQRGANAYELGKFSEELGRTVRLSRALTVAWSRQKGHKYAQHAHAAARGSAVKL